MAREAQGLLLETRDTDMQCGPHCGADLRLELPVSDAEQSWLALAYRSVQKARRIRDPLGIRLDEPALIYFAVPKAACSTMKQILARLAGVDERVNVHNYNWPTVRSSELCQWPDHLPFTIVRNPWDRLHSCYKDKIVGESRKSGGQLSWVFRDYNRIFRSRIFEPEMEFDAFVRAISRIPDSIANNHFRSHVSLLGGRKRVRQLEKVLRFESLEEDIRRLLDEVRVDVDEIPATNTTNKIDFRTVYDEATRELVARRYRNDIECFGYDFDS